MGILILAVDDEAAESIETCRPIELSLLLTSSAILFWLNAGFSSIVTNWYQDVIFSCLKHSSRIRSLRSDDDCADRSRSVSLPGSSPNWDPKTRRLQSIVVKYGRTSSINRTIGRYYSPLLQIKLL